MANHSYAIEPTGPTHVVRFRTKAGAVWLDQHRVGTSLRSAVHEVGGLGNSFVLEAVHALDFAAGTITDVTADVLHAVAAEIESERDEMRPALVEAFAKYGVPEPRDWSLELEGDDDAEHRLTGFDYGVGRAA